MNQHAFAGARLTRLMTTVCTVVFLGVFVYSFYLAVDSRISASVTTSATLDITPVVIIDPGHGGEDGGAQSDDGTLEKHINLSVSLNLREMFDFLGYTTVMTRNDDSLIYDESSKSMREKKVSDIHNRLEIINSQKDPVFLSIHQNHYEGASSRGTQVFYSGNDPKSEILAQCIQQTIVSDMQKDNKRLIKKSGKEIYLLCHAQCPAVMVECGFLSNPQEAEMLQNEEYQRKMSFEILKGTVKYLSGG